MSVAALVFPNQLFAEHPALDGADRVVLVEDDLYFHDERYPAKNHKLRLVLHRATMQRYARDLADRGHTVETVAWADRQSTAAVLARLADEGVETVRVCEPVDFILERRLHAGAQAAGIELDVLDTPLFLNTRAQNADFFAGRKRYHQADFYKHQRRRLDVLMDDGEPVGGQWSYDTDNRKKMTAQALADVPPVPKIEPDEYTREAQVYVETHFPDHVGASAPLPYPTTHAAAADWLAAFVAERLERFGPFEDAVEPGRSHLYHAVLTPMLNIGLVTPRQVLDAVMDHADGIPLNSLEGFVRQLIGWREYMRAVYDLEGRTMRTSNVWGFTRDVPEAWYTGDTGLAPVDDVIPRVLATGYANHIERLMVLGGALFLTRIHPRAAYRWFLEMFVDAYDWVMVPNTYGMSQHAAGPLITTKPYTSGSNYLRKMSHYPRGDWEAEWDGLYWTFMRDHRDAIEGYNRMGMITGHLDRMGPDKLAAHDAAAQRYLDRLELEPFDSGDLGIADPPAPPLS